MEILVTKLIDAQQTESDSDLENSESDLSELELQNDDSSDEECANKDGNRFVVDFW